jgi:hypothetical protein
MVGNLRGVSNITIEGTGTLKTVPLTQINQCLIRFDGQSNITIKQVKFDGNKGIVPGNESRGVALLQIWNGKNINVSNAYFSNNAYLSISLLNVSNAIITNCEMHDTDCAVITQGNCTSVKIINNTSIGGTSDGFIAWGGALLKQADSDILITGNLVKNKPRGSGYLLRNATNVTITNNKAIDCSGGVGSMDFIYPGRYSTITNNTFTGCGNGVGGVFKNCTFKNNKILDSRKSAIWIGEGNGQNLSDNNIVSHNIIQNFNKSNSDEAGIRITNGSNNNIENNSISDNNPVPTGYAGIQLKSGSKAVNNHIRNNTVQNIKFKYLMTDSLKKLNN